jgi:UDP-N-acetylmuramoylalanine--D-glutamate ligase
MGKELAGKRVLVMGLGRFGGGVDATRYAAQSGAKVVVTDKAKEDQLRDSISQLSDLSGIEYHLGRHDPGDFATADMVIANPAIPPDNEFLQIARRHGRTIASQMGLFFQSCPARIIGITGANGKSTTTTLTAHILENARPRNSACAYGKVWLSGNIGDRPLLTVLDQVRADDLVVL